MAGPVSLIYLDVDDEITSAASRIRSTAESRIGLVLPAGSRIGTSRINFRLLAREAGTGDRELLIVAPEGATRSLASSAGLRVYATVRELEDAVALAEAAPAPASAPSPTPPETAGPAVATAPGRDRGSPTVSGAREGGAGRRGAELEQGERGPISGRSAAADLPVVSGARGRGEGRRRIRPVLVVLLVILVVAGGVAGTQILPAATIVVTPRIETVGPLSFDVLADPTATGPDLSAGIVPATQPSIPLEAMGDYPATGKKVTETKATGTVTFSSFDTGGTNRIAAGSIVATQSDIRFVTAQAVILPPATLVGIGKNRTVVPSTGDTPVTAVKAGTASNVASGAIVIVPSGENPVVLEVTNKAPTTGGTHSEALIVDKKDVDAAMADLTAQLDAELDQVVSEPGQILPGLTVFPETKQRSDPVATVDPATLVGQQLQRFSLSATATGTVTAVDETAVTALATSRLRAAVAAGHDLVAGSLDVTVGDGRVQGPDIVFPVRASAQEVRRIVAADLVDAIRGRSRTDARSILEEYGDATIDLWPGFVSSIPSYAFRIDLTIRDMPAVEGSPSPSGEEPTSPATVLPATPRPTPRPTSRPTARPSPSGSPSAAP